MIYFSAIQSVLKKWYSQEKNYLDMITFVENVCDSINKGANL